MISGNCSEILFYQEKNLSAQLKDKIYRGGLTPDVRPLAWKRILGLIDDNESAAGKNVIMKSY